MSLTTTERQQFHDLGYVVKEDIYSQADLQPLKDGLTAVIDQTCAALQKEGLLGAETFAAEPFETRLGTLFKADVEVGERVVRAIMGHGGGGFKEQAILDFLRHPPLVSCIESLVGPDIIGSSVYRSPPQGPRLLARCRALAPRLGLLHASLRREPDRDLLDSPRRCHH